MSEPTKTCSKCREAKALGEFHKHKASKSGLTPRCKVCLGKDRKKSYHANAAAEKARVAKWQKANPKKRRAAARAWAKANPERWSLSQRRSWLKRNYGLTPEQWATLLKEQGGCCAICKTTEPGGARKQFHVDHNHQTGDVRGLLCYRCNLMLGSACDSTETLLRAADYLIDHGAPGMLRVV